MDSNEQILAELQDIKSKLKALDERISVTRMVGDTTTLCLSTLERRFEAEVEGYDRSIDKIREQLGQVWDHLTPTINAVFPGIAKDLLAVINFPQKQSPPEREPPKPKHLKDD